MPSAPLPLLDNSPVFSVSTLSAAVRRTMEDAFGFVKVRGEVTNCRAVGSSGHLYFDLKDEQAVLKVVCWRTQVPKLAHRPENGIEMVCHGRLTTYQGQSTYQLSLEQAELAGQGAMLALLEQRRQKLAAEGLFDAARKKSLPFLPRCIGVVTSPTGAVIRDILHRISERFPLPVLLWPVPVQGQGAAEAIAAAIAGFDAMVASHRPDVLIVARGGGSLEDLWCFNEEIVVRAAAACTIPLISAVGHETDTTLIDFAADRRAPTPTAAAEMAVPVREELRRDLEGQGIRLRQAMGSLGRQHRQHLAHLAARLRHPRETLGQFQQQLDDRSERLEQAISRWAQQRQARLETAAARLSPLYVSQRLGQYQQRWQTLLQRLTDACRKYQQQQEKRLLACASRLTPYRLQVLHEQAQQRLSHQHTRLFERTSRVLEQNAQRLEKTHRLLESYSYRNTLQRGFALVQAGEGGALVTTQAVAVTHPELTITFADGVLPVTVQKP